MSGSDAHQGRLTALDDPQRLAELERLRILDTPPEADFNAIATLGAAVLRSPIAAVNFVDGERHYTKAVVGLQDAVGSSVPNDLSFCAATMQTPDGVLVLEDTAADSEWSGHHFVAENPGVGFYAGAAVVSRGERVGVVCAFGSEPRPVSDTERSALLALATQVGEQLDLRAQAEQLRELAVTDSLTGLPNRALLMDRLEIALATRVDSGAQTGVLFCDVDAFKAINDTLGHDAGDQVLCHVARRLSSVMRAGDTVARMAGDEFVAVCPQLGGQHELDALVARVGLALIEPSPVGPVRVSVGAILARPGERAAEALRRADAAMYAEKV